MKRKLLCVALSLALVFTTVFAGAGSVYAAEKSEMQAVEKTAQKLYGLYPEVEQPAIAATDMAYSTTPLPAYSTYTVPAGGYVVVVPVTAPTTGWMALDTVTGAANDGYTYVYLTDKYAYDSATGKISAPADANYYYDLYQAGESETNSCKLAVTAGRTYYILIKSANYSEVPAQMSVRAKCYSFQTSRTLEAGTKYTLASGKDASGNTTTTWFKVKAAKTGVMAVSFKEYGSDYAYAKMGLYNSKKKAVSETISYYGTNEKIYFGVKKGSTYYLKISDCFGTSSECNAYGVRYKITAATDRNLVKKAKAKKLVRKAKATNTLFTASTTKSTDWYKFYVSAKRKTQIKIDTSQMSSGELYVTVYRGTKKVGRMQTIDVTYNKGANYTLTYGKTYGKANKGTYHIKIQKSKNASGKYSVRYVK